MEYIQPCMRRWDKRSQREMKEIAFHLDSRLVRDRHNGLRGILGSRDGAGFPREGGDASQVDALWMVLSIGSKKKRWETSYSPPFSLAMACASWLDFTLSRNS